MIRRYANSFRQLIVWQEAKKLTLEIYSITKKFPQHEIYALTSQLRRSSSSVIANIAEGNERPTQKDRVHFFGMARSSHVEMDCYLELAHDLEYVSEKEYLEILSYLNKVGFLLSKFIASNQETFSLRS